MSRFIARGITGRLVIQLALIGVLPRLVVRVVAISYLKALFARRLNVTRSKYCKHRSTIDKSSGPSLGADRQHRRRRDNNGFRRAAWRRIDTTTKLATQARIGYPLNGYMDLRGLVSIDMFTPNGRHYHGVGLTTQSANKRRRPFNTRY